MRTRLLPLLIVLMASVLLALGFPLAVSVAAAQQQGVVIDRIDDTARFAALAQFITERTNGYDERQRTLQTELETYDAVYGIRAGVFYRDDSAMAKAPGDWRLPVEGEGREAFKEALLGRRSHDPPQVWPWQDGRVVVASPVVRDGDVVAVVVIDSPTAQMRSDTLRGWLVIAAGEVVAMLVAVGAAIRLTGWVLLPVRTLDVAAHDIASGRMRSRVAASGGPPELRRLARSFNEMADNVEDVLEQQRAFVADASHQLRNPLAALLLRIELLALELPEGNEEIASVRTEESASARSSTICSTWPWPNTRRPISSSPTSAPSRPNACSPGVRWPRRRGQAPDGRHPRRHRLGGPHSPVQRTRRHHRQRPQVHPRPGGGPGHGRLRRRMRHGGRRGPRTRPHRAGAGARRRPLLAQLAAPERTGFRPGPLHLEGPPRREPRHHRLRTPRTARAPGDGLCAPQRAARLSGRREADCADPHGCADRSASRPGRDSGLGWAGLRAQGLTER